MATRTVTVMPDLSDKEVIDKENVAEYSDVLELIRANYHIILGEEFKVKSLIANLMSGYNRDIQLSKEPLIKSIEMTKDCLKMICLVVSKIKINKKECKEAITEELLATEEAYRLVKKGMSFREAYKKVSKKYSG